MCLDLPYSQLTENKKKVCKIGIVVNKLAWILNDKICGMPIAIN